ncbi:MAG: DJ-1/PfpI family protein [Melioribacteraceae bacterium]|nr:DJ-1/PfpI family protein [Melioribacteraceae bacterium]
MNQFIRKSLLIFLSANNFNETEYNVVTQFLITKGYKIFVASDSNSLCVGNNGAKVRPDVQIYNMRERSFAGLIIIGGEGIKNYWSNEKLLKLATDFHKGKKLVSAICNASVILAKSGILKDKMATCYPACKLELQKGKVNFLSQPVVEEKNIITGRDPDSSFTFVQAIFNFLEN